MSLGDLDAIHVLALGEIWTLPVLFGLQRTLQQVLCAAFIYCCRSCGHTSWTLHPCMGFGSLLTVLDTAW